MPKLNMTPAALTKFIGFIALFVTLQNVFDPATAFANSMTAFVVIMKSK